MKDIERYRKGLIIASTLAILLSITDLYLLYQLAKGICLMNDIGG